MTERGLKRKLVGTVVSNRMDKTIVVLVERLTKHPVYGKFVRKRSKYMAHDPQNACRMGDKVKIVESRPLSKRKRWQIVEVMEKSYVEE